MMMPVGEQVFNTTHEPVKTFHIQTITAAKVNGGKVLFRDDSSKEVEKKRFLNFPASKELMCVIVEYWCVLQEKARYVLCHERTQCSCWRQDSDAKEVATEA